VVNVRRSNGAGSSIRAVRLIEVAPACPRQRRSGGIPDGDEATAVADEMLANTLANPVPLWERQGGPE